MHLARVVIVLRLNSRLSSLARQLRDVFSGHLGYTLTSRRLLLTAVSIWSILLFPLDLGTKTRPVDTALSECIEHTGVLSKFD